MIKLDINDFKLKDIYPIERKVVCVKDYYQPKYNLAKAEIITHHLFIKSKSYEVKEWAFDFYIDGERLEKKEFYNYFVTPEEWRDMQINLLLD